MRSNIFLLVLYLLSFPLQSWAGGDFAAIKQRQLLEQAAVEQEIVKRQQAEMVRQYMAAYQQAAVQQYVQSQKEAMIARAAQEQMATQYIAQQMAQEIAAFQIASARRDQVLAQQTALRIRVTQTAQFQQALMANQAQQYMQQVAASQMIAAQQQQTLAEYQQALLAKEVGEKAAYEQVGQAYAMKAAQNAQQLMAYQAASALNRDKLYEDIPSQYVKEVVPVSDLWISLDKSSKAWPLIIDKKAKGVTVSHYIQKLAADKGVIRKDPLYYAQMIDDMSKQNPSMLLQPFIDVLRIMAIIEYDYDNGLDKDALARRIFPDEKSFQANKQRLGK